MMFGYACDETPELMPLPIWTAHRMAERLAEVRHKGQVPYLRPDGKTQVTFEYEDGRPIGLKNVVISTQHQDGIDRDTVIRPDLIEQVINPVIPEQFASDNYDIFINPTGRFVIGGPQGDCGLTGRKIIVDTYGGMGRHGGGAFSGKDPSKVDRSAAYAARWVAKHVVASGAASRCELQVAYAIGVAHPMSILVDTFGSNRLIQMRSSLQFERCSTFAQEQSCVTLICCGPAINEPRRTATLGVRVSLGRRCHDSMNSNLPLACE